MLTLFLLTVLIYHRCFRRYDADPEPELGLPAKRLTFLSGPNRLQGYLCGTGDTLAVLAPGLGNGAFSYAPQIQWLAKAGLRVFSFDYTGCSSWVRYDSSTAGLNAISLLSTFS